MKLVDKSNAEPLDYSKVENWIINANTDLNKSYDLIFFCGTTTFEESKTNGTAYMNETMKRVGYSNYLTVGSQLSEDARIFCPAQRQMVLPSIIGVTTHDELFKEIASKEPYVDLEAALDYYFEHYNKDAKRPFVLAGHSQGSAALQVALVRYFLLTDKREYLKNMIAAYAIGYGVSKKYFDQRPYPELLHFAEGPDDFNCLISWNTEGVGEKGKSFLLADEGDETLVINPLNWKRDETYASINENQGVLVANDESLPIADRKYSISLLNDKLMDAQIDLKRGSVICSTNKNFVNLPFLPGTWGGKSLHVYDGRGYYNNMKSNLRVRVSNFLKSKNIEY